MTMTRCSLLERTKIPVRRFIYSRNELDLPNFACVNPSFPRRKTSENIIDFMVCSDYGHDMPCVIRDKAKRNGKLRSPFWYACYTDSLGRRLKKSTGLTAKSKAMEMARTLQNASDEARRGPLTEARPPELLSEALRDAN